MSLLIIGQYFPLVIGIVTLIIGILAALKPEEMSKKFGIAVNGAALPYVISTGVRDIFIGLMVLILFFFQFWKALGACHLCIGIVAISDFLVVRKYGERKASLIHFGGAVVVIAYGAWIILGA